MAKENVKRSVDPTTKEGSFKSATLVSTQTQHAKPAKQSSLARTLGAEALSLRSDARLTHVYDRGPTSTLDTKNHDIRTVLGRLDGGTCLFFSCSRQILSL